MYLSKAPLRIGLAGGSTDISPYTHEFGGAVLNATIDKYVTVRLELTDKEYSLFRVKKGSEELAYSINLNTEVECFPLGFEMVCASAKYILSTYSKLHQSVAIEVSVDAGLGGGLGSSSALMVATIGVFFRWLEVDINPHNLAKTAFHVERNILRHAGGKQDQYTAAFGGFNFMTFNCDEVEVEPLVLDEGLKEKLASNLLLYNTEKQRISGEIIKDQQQNIASNKSEYIESLHFLKKQAYDLKKSLLEGNIDNLGEVLHQGWLHKKHTSNQISNAELDALYDSALTAGATGGKVLGAGGGGYMLFYCPTGEIKQRVSKILVSFGGNITPFGFSDRGVEIGVNEL